MSGRFGVEAAGLAWLGDGGARVPEVLGVGDGWLALEWVAPGRLDARGEEELGRTLAHVHRAGAERHGATPHGGDLHLGPLRFANDDDDDDATGDGDWPAFYAERRLLPLLPHAGLTPEGARAVEAVCARMADLAGPPEPPARLHGDLWSGNVLADGTGRPVLVDPAAHGGHREVDLAMLALFGTPAKRTLAAYDEVHPRAAGHEDRVGLWQLWPLLVHAVLFGGGYAAQVERVARRYAGPSDRG